MTNPIQKRIHVMHTPALLATTLVLCACGSGKGLVDMLNDPSLDRYTIDLDANESLIGGRDGDYTSGDTPTPNGGPSITNIDGHAVAIPGGSVRLRPSFDREVDAVLVQLAGEDGYYRFETTGTEPNIDLFLSSEMGTHLAQAFDEALDDYCKNGDFKKPDWMSGIPRYEDFIDDLGYLLDMLCVGNNFVAGDYLSKQEVTTFFPSRAEQELTIWGVSGDQIGDPSSKLVEIQKVRSGEVQVSLYFDKPTDLDLHVFEPDDTEIYWANTESNNTGKLDLDSNPACSLDRVNNENIYWKTPPSGKYRVIMDYFQHCSEAGNSIGFIVAATNGQTVEVVSGEIGSESETESWEVINFTGN